MLKETSRNPEETVIRPMFLHCARATLKEVIRAEVRHTHVLKGIHKLHGDVIYITYLLATTKNEEIKASASVSISAIHSKTGS